METRELTLKEKKACIVYMIATVSKTEDRFICHAFSDFVKYKTDIEIGKEAGEDFMHIIFPELYNELKSLVSEEEDDNIEKYMKYNANNTRMGDYFSECHKSPVWYHNECDERVHFLNDLNDTLK